jgi:polysaccharide biosynthesis/export protein
MRISVYRLLFILMMTLQLTSCLTTRHTNYLQAPKNFISAYKDTFSYQDYQLKEGDRLYIQVYSLDEKTNALFNGSGNSGSQAMMGNGGGSGDNLDLYTNLIKSNGCIDFPIVGEINLLGKTIRQSKVIIEDAIKPILKINSVDVHMIGRTFSIIGSGKSGKFIFPREKVNIYQALAMAGDIGQFADRSKVKILRVTEKGNLIKAFDIRSVDIINSEFYYLEPDDVIFFQPMNEQFFGATSFWSTISTVITSISFGVGLYYLFVPKK